MARNEPTPELVRRAQDLADRSGFELSCESLVGQLLSVLAAAVSPRGRVLELGTGTGVGLAWIASGLGERSDVEVVSVESDPELYRSVGAIPWPSFVRRIQGDGAEEIMRLGRFDLIFADAPGGKLKNLEGTLSALSTNGVLLLDDMDLSRHDDELSEALQEVLRIVRTDPRCLTVELPVSSGVLLATRRT